MPWSLFPDQVFVNAASAWEIATKARLGKLPGALEVAADFVGRTRLKVPE